MAGQIVKRGDKTWLVRIFIGRDAKGKRRYFSKTIHGTKKTAQTFLTAKLREKDLGIFTEPASMFLDSLLDRWLADVVKGRVTQATFTSYETILTAYVRPKLGATQVSQIQPYDVQRLYNEMIEVGKSPRTVRYAHVLLSAALKQSMKWRILDQNPCELCDLPRMQRTEMLYLDEAEEKRFRKEAEKDKLRALFVLALDSGMRPEEYLALRWRDVDLDQHHVSVRRVLVRVKGGGWIFETPKTKKSARRIEIEADTVTALRQHRKLQLEKRIAFGPNYQDNDLVFSGPAGTPLDIKIVRDKHFKKIRDSAKVPPIRLYDLRHTMATLWLKRGEHPKVVSERLGHAGIVLTLDTYSHVIPTMQREAVDRQARYRAVE